MLLAVIEKTHYRDHLKEDPKTAETRLENIEELLVETERYSSSASDPGLAAFLENIALISDVDTLKGEEQVALMTLHNAKGLEYRAIIITGLEEGLLPHYSSFEAPDELEEERRLFYVGITRAKERLFMFCAANRMRFGSWIGNSPSRFIGEIPTNLLDIVGGDEGASRRAFRPGDAGASRGAESGGGGLVPEQAIQAGGDRDPPELRRGHDPQGRGLRQGHEGHGPFPRATGRRSSSSRTRRSGSPEAEVDRGRSGTAVPC